MSEHRLASKPAPIERAVFWKPVDDAYHVLASMLRERQTPDPLLFASQQLLLSADEHARTATGTGALGLVLGRRYRDSRSGLPYEIAERALPLAQEGGDLTDGAVDAPLRDAIRAELASGGEIIGWYCRRGEVGSRVSAIDEEVHRTVFPEVWQTLLVIDPDPAVPVGAFYLYSGKAERSYQVTFHELLAERDMPVKGQRKQSVLRWCNYSTTELVVPAGKSERERLLTPDGESADSARSPVERMILQLREWVDGGDAR